MVKHFFGDRQIYIFWLDAICLIVKKTFCLNTLFFSTPKKLIHDNADFYKEI